MRTVITNMDKLINELIDNTTLLLSDIEYDGQFSIPKNVEKLCIKNSLINKLFECNLENVRHFEIDNLSSIIDLDFSIFSSKIDTIIIKNMAFYELPSFSNLVNLKTLILENNDFSSITIDKMPPLLEVLSLNDNPLYDLEMLDFSKRFPWSRISCCLPATAPRSISQESIRIVFCCSYTIFATQNLLLI